MSIDPNVGALKEYLADITTSKTYNRFREDVSQVLNKISALGPNAHEMVKKLKKASKAPCLKKATSLKRSISATLVLLMATM